jgi:hypothetical protein
MPLRFALCLPVFLLFIFILFIFMRSFILVGLYLIFSVIRSYSNRKISPTFGYVTVTGKGKMTARWWGGGEGARLLWAVTSPHSPFEGWSAHNAFPTVNEARRYVVTTVHLFIFSQYNELAIRPPRFVRLTMEVVRPPETSVGQFLPDYTAQHPRRNNYFVLTEFIGGVP